MAPRVAKPEPRWGCRRGRPTPIYEISACDIWLMYGQYNVHSRWTAWNLLFTTRRHNKSIRENLFLLHSSWQSIWQVFRLHAWHAVI